MGLELIERCLDLPALMIERRELSGGRLGVVEQGREQPIERLSVWDTFEVVLDDPHPDAFYILTARLGAGIDGRQVGAIREVLLARQAQVLLDPPQQVALLGLRLTPELIAVEVAIRHAQHPSCERRPPAPAQRCRVGRPAPAIR